jgi:hypothetical protein
MARALGEGGTPRRPAATAVLRVRRVSLRGREVSWMPAKKKKAAKKTAKKKK